MPTYKSLIRKTPAATLRDYFESFEISQVRAVDWSAEDKALKRELLNAIDEMPADDQGRLVRVLDRVAEMSGDAGTAAILSAADGPAMLEGLEDRANGQDRALWLYVHDPTAFRHAEEIRYNDERRRKRIWDGFISRPDLDVRKHDDAIEAFRDSLRAHFSARNVYVDIFDRTRSSFEGEMFKLVQVSVYREGLPDNELAFDGDGELMLQERRPVFEAAMTYEPRTGVIEVVAGDEETRKALVRHLAHDLLDTMAENEALPVRRYDLGVLLSPFDFPTDAEDGIEHVAVRSLRLMPIDAASRRVTLECMARERSTIWAMAAEEFGETSPLQKGWVITKAGLAIRFAARGEARRPRTIQVTITMPHGCDLKELTEEQQMVGQKYLRRWGILADDEPLIEA